MLASGRSCPTACFAPVVCGLVESGGRPDAAVAAVAVLADAWLHFGGEIAGDGENFGCGLELGVVVAVAVVEAVAAAGSVDEVEAGIHAVMVADDGVGLVESAETGMADVPGNKGLAELGELVVSTVGVEAVVVGVVDVERAR